MKKFLTCVLLAMFSAGVVGCRASAEVGDEDRAGDSSYKKTTTVDRDGDTKTTKTEVKRD
jgi:hypothetical protein